MTNLTRRPLDEEQSAKGTLLAVAVALLIIGLGYIQDADEDEPFPGIGAGAICIAMAIGVFLLYRVTIRKPPTGSELLEDVAARSEPPGSYQPTHGDLGDPPTRGSGVRMPGDCYRAGPGTVDRSNPPRGRGPPAETDK